MTTLFGDVPANGDVVRLPCGGAVPVEASAIPSTGETVLTLGIEHDEDGTPLGALWGILVVDELGTVVPHAPPMDGVLPCPFTPGDRLEVVP